MSRAAQQPGRKRRRVRARHWRELLAALSWRVPCVPPLSRVSRPLDIPPLDIPLRVFSVCVPRVSPPHCTSKVK